MVGDGAVAAEEMMLGICSPLTVESEVPRYSVGAVELRRNGKWKMREGLDLALETEVLFFCNLVPELSE